MENHDEAYHVWRQAGISQRVLVHVDAHHDMAWLGGEGRLDIGNGRRSRLLVVASMVRGRSGPD